MAKDGSGQETAAAEPPVSLTALDLRAAEERAYRALLRVPGSTVSQLADELGLGVGQARRALAALERSGLVSRTPGPGARFLPAAPDVGLEALVLDKEAELRRIRSLARQLMTEYRDGGRSGPAELVEVVTGAQAVLHRFDQLQRAATEEIQVLDTPPYAGDAGPSTNDVEFEVLRRGISCKAIYDRAALAKSPQAVNAILRYVAAGEQARVTSALPLKLATFDRRLAFVPQAIDQSDIASAIVLHACSLLDVLLYVFDQLWVNATPLSVEPPHFVGLAGDSTDGMYEPSGDDRRLLVLLASGMKDEAIAHHLGWSYRTTRRRIATLLTTLRADTRFQAGLYAARRGWL